jgi:hypothetical protein
MSLPRAILCPRLIWIAFTLTSRILHPSRTLLRVASEEDRRLICSKTCVICSTAPALRSTFVVSKPCYLIALLRSHISSPAVNQKGCSPRSELSRATLVFPSRKTLARRGHAAVLRSHRLIVHKVQECGKVSSDESASR